MKTQIDILTAAKPFSFVKKAFTVFLFCFIQLVLGCTHIGNVFVSSEKTEVNSALEKKGTGNIHSQRKNHKSVFVFSDLNFQQAIFPAYKIGKCWIAPFATFIENILKITLIRIAKIDFQFFSVSQSLHFIVRPPPFMNS
ncbi:hypothetical protein [Chryseobacterium taihuense]|uniref:Lipoprotein n=1 Tax=Chryseobacterium taihuense TaxID=1141221 RepID=A0ABY0QWM3_9FLAO|nr:hypothetical protein [Chryseobacterium taihuense]SDM03313.1 hypothetical protein SAMN05216273_11142 [Chryseobacterium taihuense]